MSNPLMNASGGLLYHAKAFRWRKTHWESFQLGLAAWLDTWPIEKSNLVLVGPSAGYTLTEAFLRKFEQLHGIEPDPIARFLFEKRFPSLKITWSTTDYFAPQKNSFNLASLQSLTEIHKNSAFLFCNLFGQLPLLWPRAANTASWLFWKKDLQKTLEGVPWAAWYDRLSGPAAPLNLDSQDPIGPTATNAQLIQKHYSEHGKDLVVFDHITENLFLNYYKKYLYWVLNPRNIHLIEATHHAMRMP